MRRPERAIARSVIALHSVMSFHISVEPESVLFGCNLGRRLTDSSYEVPIKRFEAAHRPKIDATFCDARSRCQWRARRIRRKGATEPH